MMMSPPAVTRAINALESHVGVKMLQRTTRYVRVTEAGQRYFEDARRVIADADAADEAAAGINAAPRGSLTVTAPVIFGKMFVMPSIVAYLNRYPDMEVSALFVDRMVNLLDEGVDVAIRIGELPDSGMKALRVGQVHRVVVAAPSYLQRAGTPATPADLNGHVIVAAQTVTGGNEWKFQARGQALTVRVKPRVAVSSIDAAIRTVREGFGISCLMSYQVAPYVASGELIVLLEAFETLPFPIHVVHLESRFASTKVRSFVDLVAARLRGETSLG